MDEGTDQHEGFSWKELFNTYDNLPGHDGLLVREAFWAHPDMNKNNRAHVGDDRKTRVLYEVLRDRGWLPRQPLITEAGATEYEDIMVSHDLMEGRT